MPNKDRLFTKLPYACLTSYGPRVVVIDRFCCYSTSTAYGPRVVVIDRFAVTVLVLHMVPEWLL